MRKEKSPRLGKGLPMSLVNSTENYTATMYKKILNKEHGENENESSIDEHNRNTNEMMRIPQITTEELQTSINKLKKSADIKACDDETREMVRHIQRNRRAERVDTRGMEESENKSDTPKRRRGRCWKLPPDLLVASVVHAVHDSIVQQLMSKTRPKTSGRSGGILKLLPNNRSSCDVQND